MTLVMFVYYSWHSNFIVKKTFTITTKNSSKLTAAVKHIGLLLLAYLLVIFMNQ